METKTFIINLQKQGCTLVYDGDTYSFNNAQQAYIKIYQLSLPVPDKGTVPVGANAPVPGDYKIEVVSYNK